jgi:hypothetical protein
MADHSSGVAHYLNLFHSTNASSWTHLPFGGDTWFSEIDAVGLSCNQASNCCTIAFSRTDSRRLQFRDLYISGGLPILSGYAGTIAGSPADESFFSAQVAHRRFGAVSGNQQAVFSWSQPSSWPYGRTARRAATICSDCVWSYEQSQVPSPVIADLTLTSGDVYAEQLLLLAIDPP